MLGTKKSKNLNVRKSCFFNVYVKAIWARHLIKPLFVEKN